jgi:hypothetical protein
LFWVEQETSSASRQLQSERSLVHRKTSARDRQYPCSSVAVPSTQTTPRVTNCSFGTLAAASQHRNISDTATRCSERMAETPKRGLVFRFVLLEPLHCVELREKRSCFKRAVFHMIHDSKTYSLPRHIFSLAVRLFRAWVFLAKRIARDRESSRSKRSLVDVRMTQLLLFFCMEHRLQSPHLCKTTF